MPMTLHSFCSPGLTFSVTGCGPMRGAMRSVATSEGEIRSAALTLAVLAIEATRVVELAGATPGAEPLLACGSGFGGGCVFGGLLGLNTFVGAVPVGITGGRPFGVTAG